MATASKDFKVRYGLTVGNKINAAVPTTSYASLALPHGSVPSAPINGDVWTTSSGMFVQVNGSTVGPIGAAISTFNTISTVSGAATAAALWSDVTTGSIAIGAGLTTGALNLATVGTGATPIGIGHTNAITTITGTVNLPTATTKVGNTSLIQGVTGNITFPATAGTLALNPLTTNGDLIYGVATTATRLPIGTAGQALVTNTGATAPAWATLTLENLPGAFVKKSVKAATTANIATLAGGAPNTLDGVSLAANDRILVKNQTTQSQNGIYIVQTLGTGANGTWVRSADADAIDEISAAITSVDSGTLSGGKAFANTTKVTDTLGTTAIVWSVLGDGGITVSDTAPSSPTTGQLWFESDTGLTYIYYDLFWVEIGAGKVGPQGPQGPAGSAAAGGSTGQVQYNNAGAIGGAASVDIENGILRLDTVASPTTPAAGGVGLFGRSNAGRVMPAFIGPSGLDSTLQPILGKNGVSIFRAYAGATTTTMLGNSLTALGTATAKGTPASTNIYTATAGLEYLVTTAATTAVAGFRVGSSAATNQYWRGNAAGLGGFTFICRFAPATGATVATGRMFVGYQQSTAAPTDVNPSTLTQFCGVGYAKGTDTNWQFYCNAASTTTKVDTGMAVPTADRTNLFEVIIFCAPNGTDMTVQFTNLGTNVTASNTFTTNLPSNTAFGGFRGYHSVGGTSSVVGFNLASVYIETDL